VSPALQNADAATADVGMVWMLAHVSLVVPAALAFGSPRSAHVDQREVVLVAGEHFSPGLSTQL
tara:strand:- start:11 stop:202 length:192 start_codon:yes stop_codon:yes gene_type:complete